MLLYGRIGVSVRPSSGSFVTWRSLGSFIGVTFIILAVWYPVWYAFPVDVAVSQIELSAFHHGQFVDVQQLHVGQLREHCYARGRLTEEASGLRGHNRTLQERLEGAEAFLCWLCRTAVIVVRQRSWTFAVDSFGQNSALWLLLWTSCRRLFAGGLMLPRRLHLRILTQLDLNLFRCWARSLAKLYLMSIRERAESRSDRFVLQSRCCPDSHMLY